MEPRKKKLRVRYHFSLVFFATVLIFGLMFYKYIKTTTLEDVLSQDRTITVFNDKSTVVKGDDSKDDANEDSPEQSSAAVKVSNPVPENETPKDETYLDSCVFVGDSLTYGLRSHEVLPPNQVYASVSMSILNADTEKIDTTGGSMTVLEALQSASPENIYLLFSASSVAYSTPDDIYKSYSAFVNKLRIAAPSSRVYVISTPPVTENKENSVISPVKNSDINDLNEKLLKYCDDNGVYYLDLAAALKNDMGRLGNDYAENDGLHFKRSTYTKLISYVLSHTA